MSKELTWKNVYEGMSIKNPMEQQLFFLSRFFNIPQSTLEKMSMEVIYPMIAEMNEYFERIVPGTGFVETENKSVVEEGLVSERIESRFNILDFDND